MCSHARLEQIGDRTGRWGLVKGFGTPSPPVTARTDRVLKRLVSTYSDATRIDLKHSEVLRAILVAVEHAMPELLREANGIGVIRRPKNDRGREAEREQLERRIAKAFVAGMRASGLLED